MPLILFLPIFSPIYSTIPPIQRVFFVAGIVNVLMTTPLWVVNTRLKLQGATFRTKGLECSKTRKYEGIIGE